MEIRHMAIIAMNPDKLAEFYIDVFDLKLLHKSPGGGVFLTDGYMNIALLPNKAEGKSNGLNHFGFKIDDHEKVRAKLAKWSGKGPNPRPEDRPYAEMRATDPEGNTFDLSVMGFQKVELAGEKRKKQKEKQDA